MYCQSCGTRNPEDARFCKACGTQIAGPGDKGGPIVDDTEQVMNTLPDGSPIETVLKKPIEEASSSQKPARSGAGQVDAETTIAGLRSGSKSTVTQMSLSLASMSFRSPKKALLTVLLVGLALVLLGAGVSYGVMLVYAANTSIIVTTPEDTPVEIGFPMAGGTTGDQNEFVSGGPVIADLNSGSVRRSKRKGSSRTKAKSSPTKAEQKSAPAPEAPAKTEIKATKAPTKQELPSPFADTTPQSSSTAIEAPEPPAKAPAKTTPEQPATKAKQPPAENKAPSRPMPPGFDDEPEQNIGMRMYAGDVRSVIRRFYSARAQNCFDRATRNNHNIRGTVVVRFTIGTDGHVRRANVVRNTTGDDSLGQCLAGQVRSWRLPPPPGDQPVDLEMPFSW